MRVKSNAGADLSKQPQKSLILDVPPDWQLAIRSRRCGICGEEREVGTTINIGQDVFTFLLVMPGIAFGLGILTMAHCSDSGCRRTKDRNTNEEERTPL
jgi:hypothetical protein